MITQTVDDPKASWKKGFTESSSFSSEILFKLLSEAENLQSFLQLPDRINLNIKKEVSDEARKARLLVYIIKAHKRLLKDLAR
jgi:hypothetical protein